VHDDNEWGISLVSTNEEVVENTAVNTPIGTELAYTVDKPSQISTEEQVKVDEQVDLSDLMSQLKSLSGK